MNPSGAGGGDGTDVAPTSPSPSLVQLKEALRVLEQTQYLFNGMKTKVMYACGEGHLLASDEGRAYLTKIIKSLDEEHRQIRAGFPRLSLALEVARAVGRLGAIRASRSATAAGASASPGTGAAGRSAGAAAAAWATAEATAAVAAAPAEDLQAHCRLVVEQLDAAVCEEVLAAGGVQLPRPTKRPRIGDTPGPQAAAPPASTSPSSPPVPTTATPAVPAASPPAPYAATAASASVGPPKSLEAASQLLAVLLRLRALDGSPASMVGGPAASLGGMKIHALDDAGTPLSLPSTLTATLMAAAQGQASAGRTGAPAGAGTGSSGGGGGQSRLDEALLVAGAARLCTATQVRMLLPGVFVANVVLEGPGNPAPLRVAVDCADKAFELDPWATPTTQVFRRISALATRVLTYYVKRAPLSAVLRMLTPLSTSTSSNAAAAAAAGGNSGATVAGVASLLPPEPISPGAAALEDLLLWLLTCRDVFSKRCASTGRLMAWDPSVQFPVPPIFRAFKLPREELRLRALDLSRAAAYHMHVAPVEQLGWTEDVPAEAVEGLASNVSVIEVAGTTTGPAAGFRVVALVPAAGGRAAGVRG